MKRIAIIGSGPGGLCSAMLLARAGFDVKLFEQLPRVGGRTSTIHSDGFAFDLGPTFFLYPEILEGVFTACGYNLWDEVPMVRIDPQYRLVFGEGGNLLATSDIAEMDRRVGELSPADAGAFTRFMDENRAKFEKMKPVLQRPFHSPSDMVTWDLFKMLPHTRPHQSLFRYLQRFFDDTRVLLTFSFQSKYLGMSPFSCPSLFSILSFLEYEYGVWHPVGGCGELSRRMAGLAGDLGAEVLTETPVEEIVVDDEGRATGVRAGGEFWPADVVVNNADFAHSTMALLPEHVRRRWTDRRILTRRYSCSCFMMYLGVEGRYDIPHHNIYFSADYRNNLEDIERRFVLSDDPSMYIQNACVSDDTLAPEGRSTIYALIPVPHMHPNIDWARDTERYRETAFRQMAHLGLGDIRDRIVTERTYTPADWRGEQGIHLGATFNLAHNLGQMLYFRPHNRFEDVDGLYLVGGGTHPGSGLPVIYESARIAARLIQERFGMETDWMDAKSKI
jgi:phytoene desaturase